MRIEPAVPGTRGAGVALAAVTACVSGIAVFVNGYGVRRWPDAAAYTTAKNLVAAGVLTGAFLATRATRTASRTDGRTRLGIVAVAVVGGSVPFVLFFEGLRRASSADAAFVHKTLVVWVAILAVPLLHERVGPPHLAAIGLLVAGQAALTGGVPDVGPGTGESMVLAATLLWAVETVIAKRVLRTVPSLTLAVARMGGGAVLLVAWLAVHGDVGLLTGAGPGPWGWAALTGAILAAYVATWYAALARAQAIDVTAVLVAGALLTTALDVGIRGLPAPDPAGLVLVAAGGACAVAAALRPRPRAVAA